MLEVVNISKRLGLFRLESISFRVERGEYLVILGRSGSGKTQLLENLAGLTTPDSGTLIHNDEDITLMPAQKRDIGMVFQDFALFPHMTTYDNIAYPLRIRGETALKIEGSVKEIAGRMNISSLLKRKTETLSGGERQRAALARTVVTSPSLLLLDEPLASVDASLKDDIIRLLRSLNREGQTIIHVTHDYSEALALATRTGVLHNGRLIQIGTPSEVFDRPVNRFVARYTGIKNFFRVSFTNNASGWSATTSRGLKFIVDNNDYTSEGILVVRNGNVRLIEKDDGGAAEAMNIIEASVIDVIMTPAGREIELDAGETMVALVTAADRFAGTLKRGDPVTVGISPSDLIWLRNNN